MPPEPELKAAGFNSMLEQARELVGPAVFERFADGLPPELADYLRHPRLATTWLSLADNMAINDRMLVDLFGGNLERIFEIGRRQFKADLSTIYRMFVRLGSISFIAKRAAALYLTYTRNAGVMRLAHEEERMVELEVSGHPLARPTLWAYMRGSIHGAAEVSGARNVKTAIVSGGEMLPDCRIRVTWG